MKTVVLLEYKLSRAFMVLKHCDTLCGTTVLLVINFKSRSGSTGLYTNVVLTKKHLRLDVLPETTILRRESNMGPLACENHCTTATP